MSILERGRVLQCDITAEDIATYPGVRLNQGASPKTVNLEIGTVRALLRKHRMWAAIQTGVRMLRTSDEIGKAISHEEETKLLEACRDSRSRSLLPAVVLPSIPRCGTRSFACSGGATLTLPAAPSLSARARPKRARAASSC